MTPAAYHDFFLALAAAAGALFGLTIVAYPLASTFRDTPWLKEFANAAVLALSNTLLVAVAALVPLDRAPGITAAATGCWALWICFGTNTYMLDFPKLWKVVYVVESVSGILLAIDAWAPVSRPILAYTLLVVLFMALSELTYMMGLRSKENPA